MRIPTPPIKANESRGCGSNNVTTGQLENEYDKFATNGGDQLKQVGDGS